MADALTVLIVGLAAYRLATDLAWEDGPGEVYARLRGWTIERFGLTHWIAMGAACPICLSFWLAPMMFLLWPWLPWLVLWFAAAGVAALFARRPM